MFPAVMLIVNLSGVAVIWFGGHRVDDGAMGVGALTAFLAYLMQILMAVMMSTFMLTMLPRAAVCADRIVEVLDTESSVVPAADAGDATPARRTPAGGGGVQLSRRRRPGAARPRPRGHARARRPRSSAPPAPASPPS